MTPFDSWYSREVAPKLPNDCPPQIAQASREAMAACWNAALDAACKRNAMLDADGFDGSKVSLRIVTYEDVNALRVIP